jgi:phosphoglycolate phosphatase
VPPLLLLWDIDGTLLQRASLEHALALHEALTEIHELDRETLAQVNVMAAGRTDGAIARDLLGACGIHDFEVELVRKRTVSRFAFLCPDDLSAKVAPGIDDALRRLDRDPRFRFSLLTGNFEEVARLKLERAGIGSYFERGQGAFGSDAEDRNELVPIARERAGDWPRERTVVIGDTPRDIECARADGVRVLAVATGPYSVHELAGAGRSSRTGFGRASRAAAPPPSRRHGGPARLPPRHARRAGTRCRSRLRSPRSPRSGAGWRPRSPWRRRSR